MADLIGSLNESQRRAAVHEAGPLLIVAGAGTGKTTVITSKIAWLITERGIKPEEILSLTFTEKAAAEMEERVDRLLPLGYADLWISTFHSFAERLLKEHALEIGLPQDFKLLDSTGQWLLVRRNLDLFQLDYFRPLGNPTKFIHALVKLFSRAKDENVSPDDYRKFADQLLASEPLETLSGVLDEKALGKLSAEQVGDLAREEAAKQAEIASAYETYQRLLLDNNALDFGDLINYCLKLLRSRSGVLAKYQQQFKHILVDEFQDTNYAQYELVKLLARESRNVTVVGDDDQAIYKFRGASVSNILQFKQDYPEAQEIYLTDNYRSSQEILDLSYAFIQRNNPDRLEVKLAAQNGLSKKLISHSLKPAAIKHVHGKTLDDEVELAVNKIIEQYNNDKDSKWSDFAILVRANSAADDFCRALDAAKVPYAFLASRGLYQKPIVLNILAWFRLLDDYHESSAFYRVLNFPAWKLPEDDIVKLNYWAYRKGLSLYETARDGADQAELSPAARESIKLIIDLAQKHSVGVRGGHKPTQLLTAFLAESGYLKTLTSVDSLANREELDCLNQFYKKLADYEKESLEGDLPGFMELMEMELEAGESGALKPNAEDGGPETVKIMTIHASKGLEFKHVIIANLVDKKFPSIAKSDPIELPVALTKEILPEGDVHLAEERRLFYVAMTRAKESLTFTSAFDYGGARPKKLSRFLIELSDNGLPLAAEAAAELSPLARVSAIVKNIKAKDAVATDRRNRLPQKFSFTQLKAYEKCPYQYRFAHILKIPVPGKPSFSFGKSMHAALQKFFLLARSRSAAGSEPIDWTEVKDIYEASFIDDWFPDRRTRDEYYDKGLASLKRFFADWQAAKPLAEEVELGFTLKLDGEHALRGAIDRIDSVEGGLRLVDYKTGSPKDKLAPEDKEQLLIYQLAAEAALDRPVKELMFYYLENNSQITFVGKPQELEKLKSKIASTIDEIKSGDFAAKPEKEKCRWCDYRNICDFAK